MNAWLAPLANPCAAMCRRVGHWGTRKGPAELDREGGWSIPERARSDEDVCSEGWAETGRRTDGKTNCLCSQSRTQGRGDENTYGAHGTRSHGDKITKSSSILSACVSACQCSVQLFFFFKAICTKAYTSFADTGKIWINRAFLW